MKKKIKEAGSSARPWVTRSTYKGADGKMHKGFDSKKMKADLRFSKDSVTKLIMDNSGRLTDECHTKEDIIKLMHELIDGAGLDTPWTRNFFLNLDRKRGYADAMLYVYACYLAGSKLAVNQKGENSVREDDEFKEECDKMVAEALKRRASH